MPPELPLVLSSHMSAHWAPSVRRFRAHLCASFLLRILEATPACRRPLSLQVLVFVPFRPLRSLWTCSLGRLLLCLLRLVLWAWHAWNHWTSFMDAASICWMTAVFGPLSACILRRCGSGGRCTSVRLLLPCASATGGSTARPNSPASYRHTGAHSVSSSLHSRARHFLSLVSFCSRTQPPACFGWTLPSAPGCRCTRLSAHILQPVSSECHWLRPGRSGVTTTCCLLWDAAARALLVFTRPLRASAALTAPLLRAIQHAILSPGLRHRILHAAFPFPAARPHQAS